MFRLTADPNAPIEEPAGSDVGGHLMGIFFKLHAVSYSFGCQSGVPGVIGMERFPFRYGYLLARLSRFNHI